MLHPCCTSWRVAARRARNALSRSEFVSLDPPLEVRCGPCPVRRIPLLRRCAEVPTLQKAACFRAVAVIRCWHTSWYGDGANLTGCSGENTRKPCLACASRCAGYGARDNLPCQHGCDFHSALKLSKDTADLGLSWVVQPARRERWGGRESLLPKSSNDGAF